jgi:cytochrome P450
MHLNWTPFGYGSRSCPGSNLAMTELKYIIGTVVRHFRVLRPAHHKQEALDLGDVFVSGERSGHCWLRFIEA